MVDVLKSVILFSVSALFQKVAFCLAVSRLLQYKSRLFML